MYRIYLLPTRAPIISSNRGHLRPSGPCRATRPICMSLIRPLRFAGEVLYGFDIVISRMFDGVRKFDRRVGFVPFWVSRHNKYIRLVCRYGMRWFQLHRVYSIDNALTPAAKSCIFVTDACARYLVEPRYRCIFVSSVYDHVRCYSIIVNVVHACPAAPSVERRRPPTRSHVAALSQIPSAPRTQSRTRTGAARL